MDKYQRHQLIIKLIRSARITSQSELVQQLDKYGVVSTQASASRDLSELNISKIDGAYVSQEVVNHSRSNLVDQLTVSRAGDHLVVLNTGPGAAQAAALMIDRAKMSGIVGTVAGDDTIFIAVKCRDDQNAVIRHIHGLFDSTFRGGP